MIDGQVLSSVGSLGAVSYPEYGRTVDELLRRADALMYREKVRDRPRRERPEPGGQAFEWASALVRKERRLTRRARAVRQPLGPDAEQPDAGR